MVITLGVMGLPGKLSLKRYVLNKVDGI